MKIFLVELYFNIKDLFLLARKRNLPLFKIDNNYLIHQVLLELFGDNQLKLFSVIEISNKFIRVLSYSKINHIELQKQAQLYANPFIYNICNWSLIKSKQMPQEWKVNQKLSFEVKIIPIKRLSVPLGNFHKNTEIDVFLYEKIKNRKENRESVYIDWATKLINSKYIVDVKSLKIISLSQTQMIRRNHQKDRKSKVLSRTAITFNGVMSVFEPNLFNRILLNGIGRHKSFGFGMILLRRSFA